MSVRQISQRGLKVRGVDAGKGVKRTLPTPYHPQYLFPAFVALPLHAQLTSTCLVVYHPQFMVYHLVAPISLQVDSVTSTLKLTPPSRQEVRSLH